MAQRKRWTWWFAVLENGDFPVRYVNHVQRVVVIPLTHYLFLSIKSLVKSVKIPLNPLFCSLRKPKIDKKIEIYIYISFWFTVPMVSMLFQIVTKVSLEHPQPPPRAPTGDQRCAATAPGIGRSRRHRWCWQRAGRCSARPTRQSSPRGLTCHGFGRP